MRNTLLLFLLITTGCSINADQKVSRDNFEFKTGDDTELFFKNVRQSYYDLEENKAAQFTLLRFSDRVVSDSVPILNLAIVINVIQDEAYLFLEPNQKLEEYQPLSLTWEDPGTGLTGKMSQRSPNREGMFEFAADIYEGLLKNYSFRLNDGTAILSKKAEREAFKVTVSDYYRLTRLL